MATTGAKSIVIRDRSTDWTEEEVADAIKHVRHIIPLYPALPAIDGSAPLDA